MGGVGLANSGIVYKAKYMNEFTGLIINYGVIGFIFFLFYMYKLLIRVKSTALHVLVIIHLLIMSQGGHLFNLYGIIIFTIALHMRNIKNTSYMMEN